MLMCCQRLLVQHTSGLRTWRVSVGLSQFSKVRSRQFKTESVQRGCCLQSLPKPEGPRTGFTTCISCRSSATYTVEDKKTGQTDAEKYTMVYRFPHMLFLRAMSRLKIFQTGITVAYCPIMFWMYASEHVSVEALMFTLSVMTFAGVSLYLISGYARRVVGLIHVNESMTVAKISHLTFWGRKVEKFLDIKSIIPISDLGEDDVYVKLKTYTSKDEMMLFLRWGQIMDKKKVEHVIGPF